MQRKEKVLIDEVVEITCDCCHASFTKDMAEWYELQSISYFTGYVSIFGDLKQICIDLCQHCLKANLGPWLQISDAASNVDQSEPPEAELITQIQHSADRASKGLDDMLQFVEESNQRIDAMERTRHAGNPPVPTLAPPVGYQSWLHYAVATMEVRNLEIVTMFPDSTTLATSDDMRLAAEKELLHLLHQSS